MDSHVALPRFLRRPSFLNMNAKSYADAFYRELSRIGREGLCQFSSIMELY